MILRLPNLFAKTRREIATRFEQMAAKPGIRNKLICTYILRHNGKAEHSCHECQKCFYDLRRFYHLADFAAQPATHVNCPNNFSMKPFGWLSPREKLAASPALWTVQFV